MPGEHRSSESTSGNAILAAFIPTLLTAVLYLSVFALIRNSYRKIYAPRTFLGTVDEKDRTPQTDVKGSSWFHDFRSLPDSFVLQHNSLDAYLFLRFLKFAAAICFAGCCITWPILLPINAIGGGTATQLDRLTFSNIAENRYLWAHVTVAWVFFLGLIALIARERLRLIGMRQAYLLDEVRAARLSSRTVLFLNATTEACQPENLQRFFGHEAIKSWPVRDSGDLDELVAKRDRAVAALENAEVDFILKATKRAERNGGVSNDRNDGSVEGGQASIADAARPRNKTLGLVGPKSDLITDRRKAVQEHIEAVTAHRSSPGRSIPERSAVFVAFQDQAAAHRAYQAIRTSPPMAVENRFLAPRPKEVLWKNLAMPIPLRLSKASLALVFVIAFTILFTIPTGLIGTISNVKYLADRYSWLNWIDNLPPVVLALLTGYLPPFLTSWFTSYVPKLFRHIAKLSGEPTTSQAELKTQAWYFVFQVFQIFLVTTFSSGAAAVATSIARNPGQVPTMLAESLPKASNFYLTYFILQGTAGAADKILNYSDLFEYIFYERFWDKTPRDKFKTHGDMKGTPWAAWYPKFTNFVVIAIAYACVAPLVLGFATAGLTLYYFAYRYQLLYVVLTKIETNGESYKRALQHMPTGIYLAELCLLGLFAARKASVQATLMTVLLGLTAVLNLLLDRTLRPLELYLGVDIWQEQEVPLLAQEDDIPEDDEAALHAASHGRRLGIKRLPNPLPRKLSDFFDSIISNSREHTKNKLHSPSAREASETALTDEEIDKAYALPALLSQTPKVWIPEDKLGVSKQEVQANESAGIPSTDDGAEVGEQGKLYWDHRFENVPIWKSPKAI